MYKLLKVAGRETWQKQHMTVFSAMFLPFLPISLYQEDYLLLFLLLLLLLLVGSAVAANLPPSGWLRLRPRLNCQRMIGKA